VREKTSQRWNMVSCVGLDVKGNGVSNVSEALAWRNLAATGRLDRRVSLSPEREIGVSVTSLSWLMCP